ncbi:MAG TPA: four helix bundle protein [Cyclobacteriaceae bacterium]|nr:four helix bundle protein [Cyclobacteriaceae bacterium]HMV09795.1 four helix bundle protein [Cyclobacteriaceae bacterium]HMV89723.1 four helix bundle protein [Cyclobacteriaceae bacterium]HMX00495.1 four helix bundle protein [Cyclobacteriaceae bacterium]HMX50421.1 four helix bundle protein [Cyclobacteriaceae bacterium]
MITSLDEFKAYNLAMKLAESVWNDVMRWNSFEKETIGKQLVRSCDSIAANLSEGLGRYHYKETRNFSYYSRGSLFETRTWLTKAFNRGLIERNNFDAYLNSIDQVGKMINGYIKSIGNVSEPEELYGNESRTESLIPND